MPTSVYEPRRRRTRGWAPEGGAVAAAGLSPRSRLSRSGWTSWSGSGAPRPGSRCSHTQRVNNTHRP